MGRRVLMMMMGGADGSAAPISAKVLFSDERSGGNNPLYNLMNGYYVMLGLKHSPNFFTEADLGRFNGKVDCSFAPALLHFNCMVSSIKNNVLDYLPNCTVLDAHNHSSLQSQDIECSGMTSVKEIRFDGTAVKNLGIDGLANLESVRYGKGATALKFNNNTKLKINL